MTAVMTKTLLSAAAATAGDKTAVAVANKTPFLAGREALIRFNAQGQTGTAPAWAVDGSVDNSTWVADIATSVVAAGMEVKTVKCYPWMRASVTTAAGTTAGTLTVTLEPLK